MAARQMLVLLVAIVSQVCGGRAAGQCDVTPAVSLLGTGTSGTSGVPELGSNGAPIVGFPFSFQISGGKEGAHGFIVVSRMSQPKLLSQFRATLYPAGFVRAFPIELDGAGAASVFPIDPVSPFACGVTVTAQVIIQDEMAPGGYAFTNALQVRFSGVAAAAPKLTGDVSSPTMARILVVSGTAVQPGNPILIEGAAAPVSAMIDASGAFVASVALNPNSKNSLVVRELFPKGIQGPATSLTVIHDSLPPNVLIDYPPQGAVLGTSTTPVIGHVSDTLSGIYGLAVSVNGFTGVIQAGAGTSGTFLVQDVPLGSSGATLLTATATDGVGNEDSTQVTVAHVVPSGAHLTPLSSLAAAGMAGQLLRNPVVVKLQDPSGQGLAGKPVTFAVVKSDGRLAATPLEAGGMKLTALTDSVGTVSAWWTLSALYPAQQFAVGATPVALAIGDLNLDGLPDLAVANQGSSSVSVLLGQGGGSIAPFFGMTTGFGPSSLGIGDLNLDGLPDLAVANRDSNSVTVLLGQGDGTFANANGIVPGLSAPSSLAISDVNLDGLPDLAISNQGSNNVSVLLGKASGGFAAPLNFAVGSGPISVAIGDLNLDGLPDLAVANQGSNSVSVLLGQGGGSFAPQLSAITGSSPASVAIGDLNLDGLADLAVANQSSNDVSILLGKGGGSFSASLTFAVGNRPMSVAIADLDQDGKLDLAIANLFSGNVSELLGNGDGSFASPLSVTVSNPNAVAIGDMDLDGLPDLAVANSVGTVSVLLGTGGGDIAASKTFTAGSYPVSVAPGDLNLDGVPDLAIANANSNNVSVLLGQGGGKFAVPLNFPAGSFPGSVTIGDVNLDGMPDLAVANQSSNNVSVLLGEGGGNFGPPLNSTVGSGPGSVAMSDLDIDGLPDLVIANSSSNNVSVLLGKGDGSFAAPLNFTVGSSPVSVAIGDLNLDGLCDLAVAISGTTGKNVSVLFGKGGGDFSMPLNLAVGHQALSVAIGDINLDGVPDIAVGKSPISGENSGIVQILLSKGGNFAPPLTFPIGGGAGSVSIGDLDCDGLPDLAVRTGYGAVSVLVGQGGGAFAKALYFNIGLGGSSMIIGDLNLDGLPDLVAPSYLGSVSTTNVGGVSVLFHL